MKLTRRDLLRGAGASAVLGSMGCSIFGGDGGTKELLQRQAAPYNAEPSLDSLTDSWITPFSRFYVRTHGNMPEVDSAGYKLTIEGMVNQSLRLSLEDLDRLPKVTVAMTMQCAGNRRSEHSRLKTVGGVQWEGGAISTGEWRGPRLADVLDRAGVKAGARFVWFEGSDSVTLKDRQTLFGGQAPLEKALRPETIVALEMNGRPLSREHGFPARTVIPGYIGARSVKWLGRIVVSDRSSDNNFVSRDYKMFPPEATVETVKPENFEPIYENVLNSVICRPLAGQTASAGRLEVQGFAVPPGVEGGALAGVEVSPDGGATWAAARFTGKDVPYAWRLWSANVTVAAGARTLVVRATDAKGATQPERSPWNFKGYLYNGWHRVPITVT